ncbi:MAG: GNAT family N-acetyltransferase [Chloroflexi bacterium]|nr:GNAT family N-acetyltransferase [Chloroflexota bacterium]
MDISELHLEGKLTVLRPKRPEDAEADYAWRVDPELAALDATSPLRMSLKDYIRYFRDELEYPSPWSVRLAIDTRDGVHIGNCMYYDINDQERQAELGIMIGDRRYWDRGYGSDALMALLGHVFTETPLERIYLHTLEFNGRAQKAFRRVGFYDVSRVRRDGHNFLLMEARRAEWLAKFGHTVAREREHGDNGVVRDRQGESRPEPPRTSRRETPGTNR